MSSRWYHFVSDHADVLLQKAFLVGTTTALDTSSYITDTLEALNLETTVS